MSPKHALQNEFDETATPPVEVAVKVASMLLLWGHE